MIGMEPAVTEMVVRDMEPEEPVVMEVVKRVTEREEPEQEMETISGQGPVKSMGSNIQNGFTSLEKMAREF